jgi:3-hydroxybutyryl-CoA dehydrogenase
VTDYPQAVPRAIGVAGAGTMGAGIAQLGVLAGIDTYLHDPFPEALERGGESVHRGLAKGAERGRWSDEDATSAEARLVLAGSLEELAGCELVIEAAPERIELKRELFERLLEVCGPETVIATNTSSILVTSLASAAARPENVVGMHFFNPPPLMKLLEVIAATQTGERALAMARAVGEAMGKRVIVASDGPGFLVNRCGRPFGAEALRLLQERVATHDQIDRVCRLGGGFRMGPFELMDLVGIDVGFEVAKSFDEQSFGEPRWKPNALQARMVASGRLGRKTGAGWYQYREGQPHRPEDPQPPLAGGGREQRVAIDGGGELARQLRDRARAAGFDAREPGDFGGDEEPELVVDASVPVPVSDLGLPPSRDEVPTALLCADSSLHARGEPAACGFHLLPPIEKVHLVELTRLPTTPEEACTAVADFFGRLGFHVEWVGDGPGLVLGRIVCQLVNEAAFAVGEGVGRGVDVDAGLTLGLNHPRGPVEWGRRIGFDHVLATVDGLWEELRDPRYRAAPLLRHVVADGSDLVDIRSAGATP